ncbi:hypothetical protein F5877DRAFT_85686 [Lentinula edodes]|nr:hypothetical protein F5877DRAFT_85686 [Lentinula edodes]
MSDQSDRLSTPDYQCDANNIESGPPIPTALGGSQADITSRTVDRPGVDMSSQIDPGEEPKRLIDPDNNLEHSHSVNEQVAESNSRWKDEAPHFGPGWLRNLRLTTYFSGRLTSMHMYYENTWADTRWNLNLRTNLSVLQRMQTDDIANLNISNLMFHLGTLTYTIVGSKLAWNILILVQQSLRFYHWSLGVLFYGVGVITFYLLFNRFSNSDRAKPISDRVRVGDSAYWFIEGDSGNTMFNVVVLIEQCQAISWHCT